MAELNTLGAVVKAAYEGEPDTNVFDDAAAAKLAALELPTEGVINITLGAGGDFETGEALRLWLLNTNFHGAQIYVTVTAGTYTFDERLRVEGHRGIQYLSFTGASKATCIFQFTTTTEAFTINASNMYATQITFTCTAASGGTVGSLISAATLNLSTCDITNFSNGLGVNNASRAILSTVVMTARSGSGFTGILAYDNSWLSLTSVTVDLTSSASGGWGVSVSTGAVLRASTALTIRNCGIGLRVNDGGHAILKISPSYTGNSTNESITRDVRQADGSLIQSTSYVGFAPSARVDIVSGTTYTILSTDNGKTKVFTNAAAVAVTLPDGLPTNFQVSIVQAGTGVPTVTRSGSDTVNGVGTGVAPSAQWKALYLLKHATGQWVAVL